MIARHCLVQQHMLIHEEGGSYILLLQQHDVRASTMSFFNQITCLLTLLQPKASCFLLPSCLSFVDFSFTGMMNCRACLQLLLQLVSHTSNFLVMRYDEGDKWTNQRSTAAQFHPTFPLSSISIHLTLNQSRWQNVPYPQMEAIVFGASQDPRPKMFDLCGLMLPW